LVIFPENGGVENNKGAGKTSPIGLGLFQQFRIFARQLGTTNSVHS
ncbi:hypothetical protein IV203_004824, partial [Nitzschia inconspicua]